MQKLLKERIIQQKKQITSNKDINIEEKKREKKKHNTIKAHGLNYS